MKKKTILYALLSILLLGVSACSNNKVDPNSKVEEQKNPQTAANLAKTAFFLYILMCMFCLFDYL